MLNFIWGCVFGACFLGLISIITEDSTRLYRQGQIDALTGKVVYELKKQSDGSTAWVKK